MRWRPIIFVGVLLATAFHGHAAGELNVRLSELPHKLRPGDAVRLTMEIEVFKPWHINANPASEGLIPTELIVERSAALTIDKIVYPAGQPVQMSWSDSVVSLYTGKIVITAAGRIRPDAPPGPLTFKASFRYQACDDKVCVAPQMLPLTWQTEIGASDGVASAAPIETDNSLDSLARQRRWSLLFVIVFFGGLALNLTPCVYPMIAITVSYFGGQGEKRVGAAFARALMYCLGIVLTYSVLGLVAALTGGLFGALLQSPVVLIGVAVLLVALALSMFGLYELQPPSFLMQKAAGLSSKAGFIGVFLLGATVGIIAAPCLGPIILSVFVFVAQRGDPWLGWWMFFTLACGLGLPYVLLGTFSGLLVRLPKSGTWMVWVKRVFGVALIGVAIWFVYPLLGFESASPIAWQPYSPELVARADKPVLIDATAKWCIPCKEMDKRTFMDERVVAESRKFLMLKVDLTQTGSPAVQKLTDDFKIIGFPTFVFLGTNGQERANLRRVGFVPAPDFLELMKQAQSTAPGAPSSSTPDIPPQLLRPF